MLRACQVSLLPLRAARLLPALSSAGHLQERLQPAWPDVIGPPAQARTHLPWDAGHPEALTQLVPLGPRPTLRFLNCFMEP